MSVDVCVMDQGYPIGTGDFFYSFFSTVCYRLENKKWGSVYPVLMKDFYQGELRVSQLDEVLAELSSINTRLKDYSPNQVVWSIENLEAKPPWGDQISPTIKDLSMYFITCEGENLLKVLKKALEKAKENQVPVFIQ